MPETLRLRSFPVADEAELRRLVAPRFPALYSARASDLTLSHRSFIVAGLAEGLRHETGPRHEYLTRIWRVIAQGLRFATNVEHAADARDELAALVTTAGHDLAGPLQGIRADAGRLEMLIDEWNGNDTLLTLANSVDQFALEADEIAQQFQRASEEGSIGERYHFVTRDVGPIVQEASRAFMWRARRRRITIDLDDSLEGLSHVQRDTSAIARLFQNIVGNAVKYSGDGNTVEISARESAGHVVVPSRM